MSGGDLADATVLIVEDGSEYLESLSRFVTGPRYLQARCGREALHVLAGQEVHLLYLDMRFDRIPLGDLLGDPAAMRDELGGDEQRAWSFLQRNQGLYILDAVRRAGYQEIPAVLAYDFSHELRRFENLRARDSGLSWVPDTVTADEIRALLGRLLRYCS